jgi:hypothetical protein
MYAVGWYERCTHKAANRLLRERDLRASQEFNKIRTPNPTTVPRTLPISRAIRRYRSAHLVEPITRTLRAITPSQASG